LSIAALVAHQGAVMQDNIQVWEDKRVVSKYALDLQQPDNGVKIPPMCVYLFFILFYLLLTS